GIGGRGSFGPGAEQPARGERSGGSRDDGGDRGGDERDCKRNSKRRRRSYGHAGNAGEDLGSVSEGDNRKIVWGAARAGEGPAQSEMAGTGPAMTRTCCAESKPAR